MSARILQPGRISLELLSNSDSVSTTLRPVLPVAPTMRIVDVMTWSGRVESQDRRWRVGSISLHKKTPNAAENVVCFIPEITAQPFPTCPFSPFLDADFVRGRHERLFSKSASVEPTAGCGTGAGRPATASHRPVAACLQMALSSLPAQSAIFVLG